MLFKTKGIVLHYINYGDNSVIAKIYTEQFGLKSYIINGVRSKTQKRIKINLLQQLTLLDLEVYNKEKKNIQRIKEVKIDYPFNSLLCNPVKSSIVLLIAEILNKSIKEEEANHELFNFLYNSIKILDLQEVEFANFHLVFMIQLSKHMGFYPRIGIDNDGGKWFDLMEGIFVPNKPSHQHYIEHEICIYFKLLLDANFEQINKVKLNRGLRNMILDKLIEYYKLHLNIKDEIKSIKILQAVMC